MGKPAITAIAAAIAVALGTGAMATGMSKDAYQSGKANIAAEYKLARSACDSFSANAKQVCMADAKGKDGVAKAELEAGYKPSNKARYNVSVARAEAGYSVAMERCDDKAGNVKDVCVKEAKAAAVTARADAGALLKTDNANEVAARATAKANVKAFDKGVDARRDAASDKRDADYAVAKEKCDAFAGDAKTGCMSEAKARFGKL